nr:MAG TPA: hypothetical protein [Caudoviricetes sp.]
MFFCVLCYIEIYRDLLNLQKEDKMEILKVVSVAVWLIGVIGFTVWMVGYPLWAVFKRRAQFNWAEYGFGLGITSVAASLGNVIIQTARLIAAL